MKKKVIVAVVLGLVTAAIVVPAVVFAAPSPQGAPPDTVDQAAEARPWIGIAVTPLSDRLAERLDLTGKTGLLVRHVVNESPAAQAGLQQNDLITTVNGEPVSTVQSLQEAVKAAGVDGSLTLGVFRDGAELPPLSIQLAERPGRPRLLPSALPGITPHGKLHESTTTYEDADGNVVTINVVAGTVSAKGDGSLTVQLNGGGEQTVAIAGDVKLVKGWQEIALDQVEVGAQALIIRKNGELARVQIGGFHPFHDFRPRPGIMPGFSPQLRERLGELPGLSQDGRDELRKRFDEAKTEIRQRIKNRNRGMQRPNTQRAPVITSPGPGVDA